MQDFKQDKMGVYEFLQCKWQKTTTAMHGVYVQSRGSKTVSNEPSHEIMVLFVHHKLILQTRMRSHPVELDV